jgi:hypothetical protein
VDGFSLNGQHSTGATRQLQGKSRFLRQNSPDQFLSCAPADIFHLIENIAGGAQKGAPVRKQFAQRRKITEFIETVPVLALLYALESAIVINRSLVEAFPVELVPYLALGGYDQLQFRPVRTVDCQIIVPVCFPQAKHHLLAGGRDAGSKEVTERQQHKGGILHSDFPSPGWAGILSLLLVSTLMVSGRF